MDNPSPTFGELLRAVRLQAGFPTLTALANHLSTLGLDYSDEAIGHWENDRRVPARDIVLRVLSALAARASVQSIANINQMLWLLGWRDLDQAEREQHFPGLVDSPALLRIPQQPYDRLIGRDSLVEEVAAQLLDPEGKPIVTVSGLGGIGKTALAYDVVEWVRRVHHFDSFAWAEARSEEFVGASLHMWRSQPVDWPTILIEFARQLGRPDPAMFRPDQIQSMLRDTLHSSRILLVLDNLETLDAARDLALALHEMVGSGLSSPSRALITVRLHSSWTDSANGSWRISISFEPELAATLSFHFELSAILCTQCGLPDFHQ